MFLFLGSDYGGVNHLFTDFFNHQICTLLINKMSLAIDTVLLFNFFKDVRLASYALNKTFFYNLMARHRKCIITFIYEEMKDSMIPVVINSNG